MTWAHHLIAIAFLFALGSAVGSFLNVCVYRIPAGRSVLRPASYCPRCSSPIAGYDNIPIVSWLALRGKCRRCSLPISPRYPMVEALVGLLLVGVYLTDLASGPGDPLDLGPVGAACRLVASLMLLALLVTGSLIAYDTGEVPPAVTAVGTVLGIALGAILPGTATLVGLRAGAAGFAVGGALAQAVRLIGRRAAGSEVVRSGEVAFAAMVGAFVGWRSVIPILMLAVALGRARVHLGAAAQGRCNRPGPGPGRPPIPLGTGLGIAAILLLLAGPWVRGG